MNEKEKTLAIIKESEKKFEKCEKQLRKTTKMMLEVKQSLDYCKTTLKRIINEEINQGNIHKNCKHYNNEKDYCHNYLLSKYTDLAFEVSKNNKCIGDDKK